MPQMEYSKYDVFQVFEQFSYTLRVAVRSRKHPDKMIQKSRQVFPDECHEGYERIAEEMVKECIKELENGSVEF